jgi:signal transduction histidine kinase
MSRQLTNPDGLQERAGNGLFLPKPPGVVRRFWARHPWFLDSIVAGAYFLVALGMAAAAGSPRLDPVPDWIIPAGLGIGVAAAAAVLFRRHRPRIVFAVACLTTLAGWGSVGILDLAAIPIALYALAVYRSTRDAWIGFAIALMVGTATSYLITGLHGIPSVPPFGAAVSSGQFAIVLLLVTLIGVNVGNRRRYLSALIDRAEQLARERDQQAQLASASERSRIAREMHDIVSHSLSVMVTLADGSAAAAENAPLQAVESMREVAETGRHALTDMRRMLGLLSVPSADSAFAELTPQPGVANLTQLVRTFRLARLPVQLDESGNPPTDAAQQLTIYRIVQESLTNVLRHASDPTTVTVDLRYDIAATKIEVIDNGKPMIEPPEPAATRGLLGMQERVTLYNGTIDSGPGLCGGWCVRATLPREQESSQ